MIRSDGRLDQRERLLVGVGCGAVAVIVCSLLFPWQLTVLAGWDAAALFIVASVWPFIIRLDPAQTAQASTREDDSHRVVDLLVVAASVVSLIGVVIGLAHAHPRHGAVANTLTGLAVFTVAVSWFTVHTLFVLRYARLFYTDPVGGIMFGDGRADANDDDLPDYLDFVYFAFTVGMTFQVSDTSVTSRIIRRTIIRHSLLSYLFGTVIVGVTINVVGGIIS